MPTKRQYRYPVSGFHTRRREEKENKNRRDFDEDENFIDARGFFRASNQKQGDDPDNDHRRQIDQPASHRSRRQRLRQMKTGRFQQASQVRAPTDRDCRRTDGIFQNQSPADEPRDDFTERAVRVRIARARHRQGRCQFRIRECDERAGDPRQNKGKHDARTGIVRRDHTRQHEDARADNDTQTEQGDVDRVQTFFQRTLR